MGRDHVYETEASFDERWRKENVAALRSGLRSALRAAERSLENCYAWAKPDDRSRTSLRERADTTRMRFLECSSEAASARFFAESLLAVCRPGTVGHSEARRALRRLPALTSEAFVVLSGALDRARAELRERDARDRERRLAWHRERHPAFDGSCADCLALVAAAHPGSAQVSERRAEESGIGG